LEFTERLHLVYPGNYTDLCIYPLPPADITIHDPLHLLKFDLYPRTRIPKTLASYLLSLAERSGVRVNVLSKSEDILQSSIDSYWVDNIDSSLMQELDCVGISQIEE
jgi:hypothetical protein